MLAAFPRIAPFLVAFSLLAASCGSSDSSDGADAGPQGGADGGSLTCGGEICAAGYACTADRCVPVPHLTVRLHDYESLVNGDVVMNTTVEVKSRALSGAPGTNPQPPELGVCHVASIVTEPSPFKDECLDIGSVSVSGGGWSWNLGDTCFDGVLEQTRFSNEREFEGGETISLGSTGGSDIGAFDGELDFPPPLNMTVPSFIDRGLPLTITWEPAQQGKVFVVLDDTTTAIICTVPDDDGTVTVDGSLMEQLGLNVIVDGLRVHRTTLTTTTSGLVELQLNRQHNHILGITATTGPRRQ